MTRIQSGALRGAPRRRWPLVDIVGRGAGRAAVLARRPPGRGRRPRRAPLRGRRPAPDRLRCWPTCSTTPTATRRRGPRSPWPATVRRDGHRVGSRSATQGPGVPARGARGDLRQVRALRHRRPLRPRPRHRQDVRRGPRRPHLGRGRPRRRSPLRLHPAGAPQRRRAGSMAKRVLSSTTTPRYCALAAQPHAQRPRGRHRRQRASRGSPRPRSPPPTWSCSTSASPTSTG